MERNQLLIPSNGVVDHVRLSLLFPISHRDRAGLSSSGFEVQAITIRAKRGPGNHAYDLEPGAELFVRHRDGCRVLIWSNRVAVIGSLARMRGLGNSKLHLLSTKDVVDAVQLLTECLPWTTRLAGFQGQSWAIAEIALSRDVEADASAYASVYERTRWKRTRSFPKPFKRGLAWEGSNSRLTLYDKGAEMIAHGVLGGPGPGKIMRVEREWRGARSIISLAKSIEHGKGWTLPMLARDSSGGIAALPYPVDQEVFHAVLARELSLLDAPSELFESRSNAIAAQMAKDPKFEESMRLVSDRKTYQKDRERILALRLDEAGVPDLLQACYGKGVNGA